MLRAQYEIVKQETAITESNVLPMKTLKHILKALVSRKELSHINFSDLQNFRPQSKENSNKYRS